MCTKHVLSAAFAIIAFVLPSQAQPGNVGTGHQCSAAAVLVSVDAGSVRDSSPGEINRAAEPPAKRNLETTAILSVFSPNSFLPVFPEQHHEHTAVPVFQSSTDIKVFAGARIRDVIQLQWEAASDSRIIGFEIDHRSQLEGEWRRIGYFPMKKSRSASVKYSFVDYLRGDGVSYYRLRQIAQDGKRSVSPVLAVTPDEIPRSFEVWNRNVQPFSKYATVSFGLPEAEEVRILLCDKYGKRIETVREPVLMEKGHHVVPFKTMGLQAGMYFLYIYAASGIQSVQYFHAL